MQKNEQALIPVITLVFQRTFALLLNSTDLISKCCVNDLQWPLAVLISSVHLQESPFAEISLGATVSAFLGVYWSIWEHPSSQHSVQLRLMEHVTTVHSGRYYNDNRRTMAWKNVPCHYWQLAAVFCSLLHGFWWPMNIDGSTKEGGVAQSSCCLKRWWCLRSLQRQFVI